MAAPELPGPELPGPELPGPELPGPELPAPDEPRVHVAVDDLHVRYSAPDAAPRTGRSRLRRGVDAALGRGPSVVVRALVGVSLVARAGDAVGIVGLNGSGKSTLLRAVAGLERPARGTVLASSTPVLLGVNAAMIPDLTGRENVRLGCLAMGMTPEATAAALGDVVDLSGIGAAIDLPMRTYSSGMGARLKFAIAAASEPEILLVDEALATGDAAFRERSRERMDRLRAGAGCVFLVSHAAQTVEETCTRAIWLHQGRVVLDGPAVEVAQRYRWFAWNLAQGEDAVAERLLEEAFRAGVEIVVDLDGAAGVPGGRGVRGVRHARRQR
ncbi:polysaccharide/polyol phosphate ABC transporter ATP-binding protein [Serinibacter arcticus]|uniref:Polysaccharide/polyol phosphate ABC transporter ATP-binding protein n=1 Tax=Serinibacter arcticus TaxID=1655435 RepID=A0A2U1ZV49_9MICO|nr:ABC transporter ATP-binding protein [Serinibacter arcticus]PWD50867.1 polysaccharide/polyol phosphate ABC transporter ATP-binding protein [Serinibacter arcticus]